MIYSHRMSELASFLHAKLKLFLWSEDMEGAVILGLVYSGVSSLGLSPGWDT